MPEFRPVLCRLFASDQSAPDGYVSVYHAAIDDHKYWVAFAPAALVLPGDALTAAQARAEQLERELGAAWDEITLTPHEYAEIGLHGAIRKALDRKAEERDAAVKRAEKAERKLAIELRRQDEAIKLPQIQWNLVDEHRGEAAAATFRASLFASAYEGVCIQNETLIGQRNAERKRAENAERQRDAHWAEIKRIDGVNQDRVHDFLRAVNERNAARRERERVLTMVRNGLALIVEKAHDLDQADEGSAEDIEVTAKELLREVIRMSEPAAAAPPASVAPGTEGFASLVGKLADALPVDEESERTASELMSRAMNGRIERGINPPAEGEIALLRELEYWARRFETEPQGVGLDAVEQRMFGILLRLDEIRSTPPSAAPAGGSLSAVEERRFEAAVELAALAVEACEKLGLSTDGSDAEREFHINTGQPPDSGTRWGHANSEKPDRWFGGFRTRDEAIADGQKTYYGEPFWITQGELVDAGRLMPDGDWVLEQAHQSAEDEVGDAAEDWPDAAKEKVEELTEYLANWGRKHAGAAEFWQAVGKPEKVGAVIDHGPAAEGAEGESDA